MSFLSHTGQVLLVLLFVPIAAFAVVFGLTVRWRGEPILVTTFVFAVCESVILGLSVVALATGRTVAGALLGMVALLAFAVAAWWRLAVLVHAQFGWPRRKA